MARRGINKEKVLLLLLGGLSLSLARTPRGQLKILKEMHKSWQEIDDRALKLAIKSLYSSKLVEQKNNKNGTTTFILSAEGRRVALTYDLENMEIRRHPWDKKWRIVIFDIPERIKKVREALRYHLKRLGFRELQHSVLVLPFECHNEIEYLVEFYNARRFVRFIEAYHIDNELDLKHKFKLL